jgi:hypothetical protein
MVVGRVYSIRSHLQPELIYFGSTKESLARRLAQHRAAYKSFLAGKARYITSFRVIELGDFYIELAELVNFEEKSQLHAVERKYIRETLCVNKCIPNRTKAEYHIDHRAKHNAWQIVYNAAHCEHLQSKNTCACGGRYTTSHKSVHFKSARHVHFSEKILTANTNVQRDQTSAVDA